MESDKAILAPSGSRFSSRRAGIPNQGFTISNPSIECASSSCYSSYSTVNNVASSQSAARFSHNAQSMNPRTTGGYMPACFTNRTFQDTQSRQNVPVAMVLEPPRYPRYSTEESRMQSYLSWFHTTPTAEECAIAGFFYTGKCDLIRCFHCGIGLKDFSAADNPLVEHIKNAKTCPYLEALLGPKADEIGAIRPDNGHQRHPEGIGNQVEKYPQYRTLESRLLTFENNNFRCTKTPQELAETGLFYTGVGDEVRCFSCGGGLQNWDESDDPWTEHYKWFPHCEYAVIVNGKTVLDREKRNTNAAITMLNTTSGPPASPNAINSVFDLTSLKTSCTEMGFSADLFDTSVERLNLDGNHCPTIDDIINGIDQIQKDIEETSCRIMSVGVL
ncbi:baculoviral IAP repeat-containing protein 3-like isoform X2 [Dreissena polymorpha]|uniref:baculoviral IAP repeat-containing protein 3-like isoform X2 n=1 Tax=Dreissena polymorpha TaxID=45954 RepID=UPI002264A9AA|nr:baculoviral IAP repeat-containing protein 3-like isoform X2 [Dreissena polymorpha]